MVLKKGMKSFYVLLCLIFTLGAVSGCRTAESLDGPELPVDTEEQGEAGQRVLLLSVPVGLSPVQVQQAVVNAALERGWQVRSNRVEGEQGQIELFLGNVFFETTLQIVYAPGLIEGFAESFVLSASGQPSRNFTPPNRIRLFQESLRQQIAREIAGY